MLSSLIVLVWVISMVTLVISFFVYLFLLQSIRGNLKEYCVHKIDKRIDGLLKKKSRKRILEARKAELEELERNRNAGDARAAPPLGMAVGPRYPNVSLNYKNEAYGSEYGDTSYSRSEYGGADNIYGRAVLVAAPTRSEYGDDYAGSEFGGARSDYNGAYGNHGGSNFGGNQSEYSYGGLNPVYAGSVAGSQNGFNHINAYYEQAGSEFGGSDSYTWQKTNYSESNISYKAPPRERTYLPTVPERSNVKVSKPS